MTTATKTIDGYLVDVDTESEMFGGTTQCWIMKTDFSASLACLMDTGCLYHINNDTEHEVHPDTIDKIEKFALDNGY